MRSPLILLCLALAALALGQGGPPLLTDDPGTVEKGRWELNLSWINRQLPGRVENELPHVDLSRGVSPNAHMKIEVPWVIATENGQTNEGDGGASFGVKWRFVEGKGARPAVSTFPQVGFSLSPRSVRLGLSEGGTSLLLPIELQWGLQGLNVNADGGLVMQAGAPPGWIGGIAVGKEAKQAELLAEIHGEGVFSTGEMNWIGQVGLRHDFNESSTLLLAFGRTLVAQKSDRVGWLSFVGVQLRF